jgi:hypothetical protein
MPRRNPASPEVIEGDSCPALPLRGFLTRAEEQFIDYLIDQAIAMLKERQEKAQR